MTYRGVYDSATQYEQLDVVRYQSATYLALTDVIGEAPGTTAKWGLIAQDGVYSAVAGNGISLNGNTISLDSTVVNNLIATYLASVKLQTITAQSTHDTIPTSKSVYDFVSGYAPTKADFSFLENQYTDLLSAVAQKPSVSQVQTMIDNSIGGVLSGEY